jgi:hypothetical protein
MFELLTVSLNKLQITITATARPTRFRTARFLLYAIENNKLYGGEGWIPSAERFKLTRINADGYSVNRSEGWQHQLPKHCVSSV